MGAEVPAEVPEEPDGRADDRGVVRDALDVHAHGDRVTTPNRKPRPASAPVAAAWMSPTRSCRALLDPDHS